MAVGCGSCALSITQRSSSVRGTRSKRARLNSSTPAPVANDQPPSPATGKITSEALGVSLAALIPENAIVVDEAVTTGRGFW